MVNVLSYVPTEYITLALSTLGLCSVADAWVPQVEPGSRWAKLRAVLHFLGANYDKARKALGR